MRVILQKAIEAIKEKKRFSLRYIRVCHDHTGFYFYMWNTLIAKQTSDGVKINVAGNASRTLCLSVNTIFGTNIENNKKTGLTFNGEPWDGEWKMIPNNKKLP